MKRLTQEEIKAIVEKDYQNALKQVGETRLLGVFFYGQANVNPAYEPSEVDTITIFFPTIQDIAINCSTLDSYFDRENGGRNYWVDFRLVVDFLYDSKKHMEDIFFTPIYQISSTYQKTFFKLKEKINSMKVSEWFPVHEANVLAEGWTRIFDHYLQFRDGVQDKIFDSLTKTEEKALIFCLEEIGDEGILSISEAIRKSGVSRPVFTSMLDKLARYKGAEVKNMGVKGTYINFHDHILSKFEIS